ncbi:MAG: DUF5350 family protein [Methanomicrobiales archaeon]|nr:DUF5350 family protein [Methanomicrobiales archaeon]
MGKTGSTQWVQVKGVKGQIRLVSSREGEVKKPGPNQRFKPAADIARQAKREGQDFRRGRRGGGRSRGRAPTVDARVRRRMPRSRTSALGTKQKSR